MIKVQFSTTNTAQLFSAAVGKTTGLVEQVAVDPKYDLEDRLINYTCVMIDIVDALPNS